MQMNQIKLKPAIRRPLPIGAPVSRRKSIAGQSVFVALAVLFLLAFLGALFITVIARNIAQSSRAGQTLNADYYAQAGINYANQMLETSPQGADWRPPLQALLSKAIVQNNMSVQQQDAYFATVGAPAGTTAATYTDAGGGTYNLPGVAQGGSAVNDPDAQWLAAGFTRYNVGAGRFLIRLTYVNDLDSGFPNKANAAPVGTEKYIRIDSIGRYGNVVTNDPTTYVNQPPTRLRAEMTAYKPIGLTDYARFITNKDDRTDVSNLGVPSVNTTTAGGDNPYSRTYTTTVFNTTNAPAALQGFQTNLVTPNVVDFDPNNLPDVRPYPIITTYGEPAGYQYYGALNGANNLTFGGGSLRVNGDLRLYGLNIAYLNPAIGDEWDVAGNLLFDRYNSKPSGATTSQQVLADQQAQLEVFSQVASAATPALTPLFPSNDSLNRFTTDDGLVRDGNSGSDAQGYPRSVQRLDPPSLDTTDPATGLTRYKELTYPSNSAPAVDTSEPDTVYINNDADIQAESSNVTNGYTIRDEWLNKGGGATNWKADFYDPPGAIIRFGPIPNTPASGQTGPYLMLNDNEPAWGLTITRSDSNSSGPIFWPSRGAGSNPAGVSNSYSSPGGSQTIYLVYAPLASQVPTGENPTPVEYTGNDPGYPYFFMNAENAPNAVDTTTGQTIPDPDNDITIYADGNVRVSGMVSDPGSASQNVAFQHVTIVTGGIGYIDGSILKGGPGYTVPTGSGSTGTYTSASSAAILAESYICVNTTQFMAGPINFNQSTAANLTESNATPFTIDFSNASQALTEPVLLIPPVDANGTSTAGAQALYISQYDNQASNQQGQALFMDETGNTALSNLGAIPGLLPANGTGYTGSLQASNQTTVPLGGGAGNTGFSGNIVNPLENYLLTLSMPSSTQGWDLEHAGIFPSNARIEAILYAQNGSFFVIPGPWFNSDTADSIQNFATNQDTLRNSAGTGSDTDPGFQRFPFYGQPVDLQISVFGTVAENLPADLGDQTAWEDKWGWIPIFHGSLFEPYAYSDNGTQATVPTETAPLRDPNYNTGIPQVGLNFSYDPADGFDYIPSNQNGQTGPQYVRLDQFGRPLPVAPDLPVSTDLLYSGPAQTTSLLP